MRIAIPDDYQNVALSLADWDSLDAQVDVFDRPFGNEQATITALVDYDAVVAMRERTPSDVGTHTLAAGSPLRLLT